jgi:hypothetical protein
MDYKYEGKGVCHELLMCEPLRGWPHVKVTERRTRPDYAGCLRDLVDVYFPRASRIRLVQDNLNTHDGASLYARMDYDISADLMLQLKISPRRLSHARSVAAAASATGKVSRPGPLPKVAVKPRDLSLGI